MELEGWFDVLPLLTKEQWNEMGLKDWEKSCSSEEAECGSSVGAITTVLKKVGVPVSTTQGPSMRTRTRPSAETAKQFAQFISGLPSNWAFVPVDYGTHTFIVEQVRAGNGNQTFRILSLWAGQHSFADFAATNPLAQWRDIKHLEGLFMELVLCSDAMFGVMPATKPKTLFEINYVFLVTPGPMRVTAGFSDMASTR
jgi:hypothetical protein